jgi:hypothetical protein
MLKAYKTYAAALKASQDGERIVRLGERRGHVLFIVGIKETDEIDIISSSEHVTGHVTIHHLERLGNANLASPDQNEASAIRARELYNTALQERINALRSSSSSTTEKQN